MLMQNHNGVRRHTKLKNNLLTPGESLATVIAGSKILRNELKKQYGFISLQLSQFYNVWLVATKRSYIITQTCSF